MQPAATRLTCPRQRRAATAREPGAPMRARGSSDTGSICAPDRQGHWVGRTTPQVGQRRLPPGQRIGVTNNSGGTMYRTVSQT